MKRAKLSQFKTCTNCKREQSRLNFYPRRDRPIGITATCKDCIRQSARPRTRHYYQQNKNDISFILRNRERHRIYRKKHIHRLRQKGREYSRNHRHLQDLYRKENRDSLLLARRKRYATDSNVRERILFEKRQRRAHTNGGLTKIQWNQTLSDFNHCCAYCGNKTRLQLDHFIPLSKIGSHTQWNCLPACLPCNASKSDKLPQKWCKQVLYRRLSHYLLTRTRFKLEQFTRGFFIGNFDPCIFKTKQFEVGFKHHRKDEDYPAHYQQIATEYNLLVHGRMAIGEEIFNDGDLFVIPPGEVVKPIFISDCQVVCIKVPSLPGDRVVC